MGIFQKKPPADPPHPRKEPRLEGPLTPERLGEVFADCVAFDCRSGPGGGSEAMRCQLLFIAGMVRMERVSDYVLRPLAQDRELGALGKAVAWEKMRAGALYSLSVTERTTLDEAAMEAYCQGYKAFLDAGKTERLCAAETIRLAEERGYGVCQREEPSFWKAVVYQQPECDCGDYYRGDIYGCWTRSKGFA